MTVAAQASYRVALTWGYRYPPSAEPDSYTFSSELERDAFLKGVEVACARSDAYELIERPGLSFVTIVRSREDAEDDEYWAASRAELDAFKRGIDEAQGRQNYTIANLDRPQKA